MSQASFLFCRLPVVDLMDYFQCFTWWITAHEVCSRELVIVTHDIISLFLVDNIFTLLRSLEMQNVYKQIHYLKIISLVLIAKDQAFSKVILIK